MDDYWLMEKVEIPENKIEEYNWCVAELMRQFGCHDTHEIKIVEVLVMLLGEIYSEGTAYLMKGKRFADVNYFLELLESTLGKKIWMRSREKVWNMMLCMYNYRQSIGLRGCGFSIQDYYQILPWYYVQIDLAQMQAATAVSQFACTSYCIQSTDVIYDIDAMDFVERENYLYTLMVVAESNTEGQLLTYLQKLLEMDMIGRKKLAGEKNIYGMIAQVSLWVLPPVIICVYAKIKNYEYWEMWDLFGICAYQDTLLNKKIE